MVEVKHTKIGGSTAARTLACPAWVRYCRDLQSKDSGYAREGAAAHALLELAITNPATDLDAVIDIDLKDGKDRYVITDEMRDCVDRTAKDIMQRAETLATKPQAEVKFDLRLQLPVDLQDVQIQGTADVVINQEWGELFVGDYKYGVGTPINAVNNAQLRFYAMGVLSQCKLKPESIRAAVWQPRSAHGVAYSEEVITTAQLREWWHNEFVPAVRSAVSCSPKFRTGSHCKYCPGLATCPKAAEDACSAAVVAFAGNAPTPKQEIKLPAPEDCTDDVLRRCLDAAELIADWSDAVKTEMRTRLESGRATPATAGWKLVEGRAPARKWRDEAETRKQLAGLGRAIFKPQELLSVAEMEKMIKQQGGNRDVLTPLIHRGEAGRVLAPVSDKRPEIANPTRVFIKQELQ